MDRCVDMGYMIDYLVNEINLDEDLIILIPYILIAFGGLEFDKEKVEIDQRRAKVGMPSIRRIEVLERKGEQVQKTRW